VALVETRRGNPGSACPESVCRKVLEVGQLLATQVRRAWWTGCEAVCSLKVGGRVDLLATLPRARSTSSR